MSKILYLDHNATTPMHPDILKKWRKYWDIYGNASSLHSKGREARNALDLARERISQSLGITGRRLIFVSSGTEANNQVIHSVPDGAHIVTTSVEHACIRNAILRAQSRGVSVTHMGVDSEGNLDLDQLFSAVNAMTRLITVMTANNETGAIQPIVQIAQFAKSRGIPFHTDAVQALGKIPFFPMDLGVDCATISAHKIYGPKGIAGLLLPDDDWVKPFIIGGPQEQSNRAGTESIPLAMAFADAVELAVGAQSVESQRLNTLKVDLIDWLIQLGDVEINSPTDGLANTVNASIQGITGEAIVRNMDLAGIAMSTGSACSTGAVDPSHVIMALNKPKWVVDGAFRVSMGRDTTADDLARFKTVLSDIVHRLRRVA